MTCRSDSRRLPGLATGLGLAAGLALANLPASAQEPLFLRIRPSDAAPRSLGSGGSDAEIARTARAAREAVWEHSAVRARLAIASVCTGCLGPQPAIPPVRPVSPPENGQAAPVPADPFRGGASDPAAAPTSTRGDP